jgi:hypothetical protein
MGQATAFFCRCVCGKEKGVRACYLQNGLTRSCGCLRNEVTIARFTTHGHRKGRQSTYFTNCYRNMVGRCTRPWHPNWKHYGGRGITIYPEWLGDGGFLKFTAYLLENLGPFPGKGREIDRKNNDGNYEPGNLRWATRKQQVHNTRPYPKNRASSLSRTGPRPQLLG